MSKVINEIGKQYGMVTVLERGANDNNGKARWVCQCKCGTIFLARGTDLRRNKILTCGCSSYTKGQKLIGKKFGKLTVIEFLGTNSYAKPYYKCKCECGNEVEVVGAHLLSGNTRSCGCIKLEDSVGEKNINALLIKNNISFKRQYCFPDLIYKNKLRYDFAIIDKDNIPIRLIEFDGIQHFNKNDPWYNLDLIKRDKLKNEYALNHNIPLVRIPYYKKDSITIEDLFGDEYLLEMRDML